MYRHRITLIIFLSLFLLPSNAQSITLEEYFTHLKIGHPFFQKESLTPAIAIKAQEGLQGAEDWVFTFTPSFTHQKPVSASSFASEQIDITSVTSSLSRPFWRTGGKLAVSLTYEHTAQKSPTFGTTTTSAPIFHTSLLSVSYVHPLLQNSRGTLDRLAYDIQTEVVRQEEVAAMENQETFLAEMGTSFIDWVLLTERRRLATEREALAQELLTDTRQKAAAYLVERLDVLRAEENLRLAKQNRLLIASQWRAKQAELATRSQDPSLYQTAPVYPLYEQHKIPSPQAAQKRLIKARPLQIMDLASAQLASQRAGLEDQTRSRLDLNLSVGLQGGEETFGKAFSLDKPIATVSLSYYNPLGHHTAKSALQENKLAMTKLAAERNNAALALSSQLESLTIQLTELAEILILNEQQVHATQEKTKEELKLYRQGRNPISFVIQSRDQVAQAKLTYAENAAGYQKLYLQYQSLTDALL